MFSHPPDPGLWGSRVYLEIIASMVSLPLQNLRISLVFDRFDGFPMEFMILQLLVDSDGLMDVESIRRHPRAPSQDSSRATADAEK